MDKARLTSTAWKNFDPWECCGQDDYCKRGCHDEGGCAKGCIVPKIYAKLGKLEDDAELARSTTTDSTRATDAVNTVSKGVGQAIAYFNQQILDNQDGVNRKESGQIKHIEYHISPDGKSQQFDVTDQFIDRQLEIIDHYNLAIRALQQYRTEPCEWVDVTNGRGGHQCSKCHSYAPSYQNGAEYLSPHCPNCGRRLALTNSESTQSGAIRSARGDAE